MQIPMNFDQKANNRAPILACVLASPKFQTAREISRATGIPYKATIDALCSLRNEGKVVRQGRKFTAKWGSPALQDKQHEAAKQLQDIFHGFIKR